jgi:hypothetical protein
MTSEMPKMAQSRRRNKREVTRYPKTRVRTLFERDSEESDDGDNIETSGTTSGEGESISSKSRDTAHDEVTKAKSEKLEESEY